MAEKSKIIVIDCFKLVKGNGKSIGIYNLAHNLVKNLAKLEVQEGTRNPQAEGIEYIILGNEHNRADFDLPGVTFQCVKWNPLNKLICILWELLIVPIYGKKLGADKILFPRGFASMLPIVKQVIIIHDLIPFYYDKYYQGYFNRLENAYIMWRLKASIRSAHQVITISEASKQEINQLVKVSQDKITVIHNGCNEMAVEEGLKNTSVSPYLAAMTSSLPHKNLPGIVAAYEEYYKLVKEPLPLQIIGVDGLGNCVVDKKVKKHITCSKFIQSDQEMHELVGNASCFLFLSLVEGFGFPPIEAMQLEVPVICSNLSSLPEVVGDAAVLVDPRNPKEVAKKLLQVLDDQKLQQNLVELGKANVKRFDWYHIAKKYRETVRSK